MNSVSCRAKISAGAQLPDLHFTKCSTLTDSQLSADDYQRLKADQSATSDLPLQAMPVEMRSGIYAAIAASARKLGAAAAARPDSPFADKPARHLTRTASALAQNFEAAEDMRLSDLHQTQAEQTATVGCLPAFAARVSMHCQKVAPKAASAAAPRRQLLPPPKTQFLPVGDPCELRRIVEQVREKRSESLDRARMTARLQTLADTSCRQDDSTLLGQCKRILSTDIGLLFGAPLRRASNQLGSVLRHLIDKLAVA